MRSDEKRSIWTGLIALLVVGLVIGAVAGTMAYFGSRFAGLDRASEVGSTGGPGASLEMPAPSPTDPASGPQITLPGGNDSASASPSEEPSESETPDSEISLSASQNTVVAGEQIDLTGVYPGGEGATLRVQRMEGGEWVDFGSSGPVEETVSGETFGTYVYTSQVGESQFRMIDVADGQTSNPVSVTVR